MIRVNLAGPVRCNCLVWALARLWRRGGYLAVRRSRFSPVVPHVLWSRDLKTWWSYTEPGARHWWDALWFRGRVVMGDRAIEQREGERAGHNGSPAGPASPQ